jgi:hypothetical protein
MRRGVVTLRSKPYREYRLSVLNDKLEFMQIMLTNGNSPPKWCGESHLSLVNNTYSSTLCHKLQWIVNHKSWISHRIWNQIQKVFKYRVKSLRGVHQLKNRTLKISLDCPFKLTTYCVHCVCVWLDSRSLLTAWSLRHITKYKTVILLNGTWDRLQLCNLHKRVGDKMYWQQNLATTSRL